MGEHGRGAVAIFLAAAALTALSSCGGDEEPREFVIAALGDSYGSGEGAAEVPGRFAYDSALLRWTGTAATWTVGDADAERCHRSPRAGFVRAAEKLQAAFAAHDVTVVFRSFACSGAAIRFPVDAVTGLRQRPTVGGGALLPSRRAPGSPAGPPLPGAQVSQLQAFLSGAGKEADALLLSFGGNDVGFARVIFLCSVAEYLGASLAAEIGLQLPAGACQFDPAANAAVAAAIAPTTAPSPRDALPELPRGCAFLTKEQVVAGSCTPTARASFQLLGSALRGDPPRTFIRCSAVEEGAAEAAGPFAPVGTVRPVGRRSCEKRAPNAPARPFGLWVAVEETYPRLATPATRVYLADYPDPLQDEVGAPCDGKPDDDLATRQLARDESVWLQTTFRRVLNGELAVAARRNGWTVIPLADATGHGICATAATRWFNTNLDALRTQGEDIELPRAPGALAEPAISNGFAHPNERGYEALYAVAVAEVLRGQICAKFSIEPCPEVG
jgi:hypothetical protein